MSNRLATIRSADLHDVMGIAATLNKGLAQASIPLPEADLPYFCQYTIDLIVLGQVWVAVSPDGEIVGTLMIDRAHWPWCHPSNPKGQHLYNQHFWVDPAHRRGGTAVKLMELAKAKAGALGLPLVIDICYGESTAELKDKFVLSRGFNYIGGKFLLAPSDSDDGQTALDIE